MNDDFENADLICMPVVAVPTWLIEKVSSEALALFVCIEASRWTSLSASHAITADLQGCELQPLYDELRVAEALEFYEDGSVRTRFDHPDYRSR